MSLHTAHNDLQSYRTNIYTAEDLVFPKFERFVLFLLHIAAHRDLPPASGQISATLWFSGVVMLVVIDL